MKPLHHRLLDARIHTKLPISSPLLDHRKPLTMHVVFVWNGEPFLPHLLQVLNLLHLCHLARSQYPPCPHPHVKRPYFLMLSLSLVRLVLLHPQIKIHRVLCLMMIFLALLNMFKDEDVPGISTLLTPPRTFP